MNFKKYLLLVLVLIFAAGMTFAKPTTNAPSWFGPGNTLYQIFPRADFLAFRGEGDSEEAAIADGQRKLANNISATISDRRSTETTTLESITSEGDAFATENTTTSAATTVESTVDLSGLEYSEVYWNKKGKRYYVVAYIDIANAMRRYRPQIEDAKTAFYASYNKAQAEEDAILSCAIYKTAAQAGAKFLSKLTDAYGINPDIESDYKIDRDKIMGIPSVIQEKIQDSVLHLTVKGDYGNIVSTAVTSCFSAMGFTVDKNAGAYELLVTVSDNEVVADDIFAVYPSVLVSLINKSGRTVYSFEAKEGKTVSMTDLNTARKKAYPKLGTSIVTGLTPDFKGKVGL
ncbi:MAG: LPP20 family lipoprotein [Treponemataceae bacterium]|nr:LPP20 family lipoprotein [Treponemataceae bacterium]